MTMRRSLDESRDLLLQAGLELLAQRGIEVGLDDVKMIDVCRAAGLKTAGSAYKIWPTQDAFRADLFAYLIEHSTASFSTIDQSNTEITADARPPDLRELIRRQAAANAALNRVSYPRYVVLWLVARSDKLLDESFLKVDSEWLHALGEFFAGVFEAYELELVAPYTPELFATAVAGLVEGFTIRERTTPELVPDAVQRPTGPDGELRDWTLYGCAVEALFTAFTRPRPAPG